ncbi:MAG: peptidoglycan DD-metalloendopeptidase family protein [Candidatus Paceibacteria bacterium]
MIQNNHYLTTAVLSVLFLVTTLGPLSAGAFSFVRLFGSLSAGSEPAPVLHSSSGTPALRAALNVDPNPAKGGGDIAIVGGVALSAESGPSGTLADIEVARPGADEISIYVVREGDTISQIAELFGVSTNTVVWANDLRGTTIHPGQTLAILPVSGITHTVAKGDTLASITKKYEGDLAEVLEFNGLVEGASLAVGETIVVPYGVVPQAVGTISTTAVARGTGGPYLEGYFLRPVVGGSKTQGLHGYNGVDIGAPTGTTVLASASGEVIISRTGGYNGGYGQYIVIRHPNGTQTLYGHLSQNYVFAGDYVVQGQVIGAVGNTGRSTGPHVHFEVRGAANPF